MKTRKRRYYVKTWDTNKGDFSPQPGVRTGPYSLMGLRKAIRKLRAWGYPCDYRSGCGRRFESGDPSVLIYAVDPGEKP